MADRLADISRAGSSSLTDASHYLLKALRLRLALQGIGDRGQGGVTQADS